MASSVKREGIVEGMLDGLDESGHWYLDTANSITQNVLQKSAEIRATIDDESFTDEQITEMMKLFQDGTTKPGLAEEYRKRGWGIGMELNYENVKHFRTFGLKVLQDTQEARIQHLADDPMKGMQDTKKSISQSAADAALGEARQSGLDKASQEIADEVKNLIDERNDVDSIRQDREKDEEEQEKKEEKKEEQNQM